MKLRLVSGQETPIDRAARWAVRNDRGVLSDADRDAFADWLAEPGNADAYARAEDALDLFDGLDGLGGDLPELEALRSEAQAHAPPRRRWLPVAGGAIAAGIAGVLGFMLLTPHGRAPEATTVAARDDNGIPLARVAAGQSAYATAIGEQRVLVLEDGSRVTMNTGTQIAIAYRPDRRIVRLLRGQALFDVAHDASRPFSVVAADRRVTALGTMFEVRLERGRLQVTLVRGRVVIDQKAKVGTPAPPAPTYLDPGQQFAAAIDTQPSVAKIDVDKQLLWRQSLVEFDDAPVAQAVAELNRYSLQPLVVADPRVGTMRISGIFRTGDPEAFSELVGTMLPVTASENGRGEIELRYGTPRPR